MIAKRDRIPHPEKVGWRKLTPTGETNISKVEFADDPVQVGTFATAEVMNEFLAASGTTTGTSSAFLLAQDAFPGLIDNLAIRVKFHTAPAASFTLNVENTGAIQTADINNLAVGSGWIAGTIATFVYSSTLNRWIVQGGSAAFATNAEAQAGTVTNRAMSPATVLYAIQNTALGALGTLTNVAIAATDSVKAALQKLQGQINSTNANVTTAQTTANTGVSNAAAAQTTANNANTNANGRMPYAGGTFTGQVVAQNNTAYTTFQIRNAAISTSAPTPSIGKDGDLYFLI